MTPHLSFALMGRHLVSSCVLDANGNMLTGLEAKVMTYDGENQPLSVTSRARRPVVSMVPTDRG